MANLQSHKLQLHPTKNASGGVYDPTNGNDGTNIVVKHNAVIDTIETALTKLELKRLSFRFPTLNDLTVLCSGDIDGHTEDTMTLVKVKTIANSDGNFSMMIDDGVGQIIFNSVPIRNYNLFLGLNSWVTHTPIDTFQLTATQNLTIQSSSNISDAVVHIYYI